MVSLSGKHLKCNGGVNWNDNDTGDGYVFAFHNTEICSIDVAFCGIL